MSYVVLKVVVLAVAACAAGRIELGTREKNYWGNRCWNITANSPSRTVR